MTTMSPSQGATDLTVAATDVEDLSEASQIRHGHRDDLFFVFRIGALGEPFDPPVGIVLPQLISHAFTLEIDRSKFTRPFTKVRR